MNENKGLGVKQLIEQAHKDKVFKGTLTTEKLEQLLKDLFGNPSNRNDTKFGNMIEERDITKDDTSDQ